MYLCCSLGQDHVRAAMTCIRFFTHGASSYLQLGEQQVRHSCCVLSCYVGNKKINKSFHAGVGEVKPVCYLDCSAGWSEPKSTWGRTCRSSRVVVVEGESQVKSTHSGRWCHPVMCPGHLRKINYFGIWSVTFLLFYEIANLSFQIFFIRHMNTIELQLEVTRFLHRCETAASSKAPQTSTPSSKSTGSSSPPTLFGGSPMKVEVACKVMFHSWFCWCTSVLLKCPTTSLQVLFYWIQVVDE